MLNEFRTLPLRLSADGSKSRAVPGLTAGSAALGALAGCGGGGGGTTTPSGGDGGGSGNTTPVNLRAETGSPIVPINLAAGYFSRGGGAPLTFEATGWEDTGLMFDSATGRISGSVAMAGDVEVTVTATGGEGDPVMRIFTITAAAPVAAAARPMFTVDDLVFRRNAVDGMSIVPIDLSAGFTDPDDVDDLTFEVRFTPEEGDLTFDGVTNTISGTFNGTEDVSAIVTVTNGEGENATSVEHRILITPGTTSGGAGMSPVVSRTPLGDVTAVRGVALASPIDLRAGFDDPDGDDLTIGARVVVDGGPSAELSTVGLTLTESMLSGMPSRAGNIVIRVTATDGSGGAVTDDFSITVAQNGVPEVVGSPPAGVALTTGAGDNLPIATAAWFSDPDTVQTLTYSLIDADDTGLEIDSTGMITGPFVGTASVTVRVRATDDHGASVDHALQISANTAPATTPAAPTDAVILSTGMDLNLPIAVSGWFTDGDAGAMLTYSLVDPDGLDGTGLTFHAESGEIRGMFSGSVDDMIGIRASDEHGASVDHALQITANASPTTTPSAPTDAVVLTTGMGLNLPITVSGWFTDRDAGAMLTFSLIEPDGLDGTGLAFHAGSGEIRGTFSGSADDMIGIRATDEHGAAVDHTLSIEANAPPTKTANAPTSDVVVSVGSDLNLSIDASEWFGDSDGDGTLTYSLVDRMDLMGTGLDFDSASGVISGVFTGTGSATVRVRAGDGQASIEHAVNIAPVRSIELTDLPDIFVVLTDGRIPAIDLSGVFAAPATGVSRTYVANVGSESLREADIGLAVSQFGVLTGTFTGTSGTEVTLTGRDGETSLPERSFIVRNIGERSATTSNADLHGQDEFLIGPISGGGDTIFGGDGDDLLYGGAGDQNLWGDNVINRSGRDQTDVVIYTGERDDYTFVDPGRRSQAKIKSNDSGVAGEDTLIGIDEIRFSDVKMVFSLGGTDEHDVILLAGTGNDSTFGGAGDDVLLSGGRGDDTVVYNGDIRDFRFEMFELLAITDADPMEDGDEGSDRLHGFDLVRFKSIVEVDPDNIKFGEGNTGNVDATDSTRNVLYGEGGGYTLNGGTGVDIFQFLTSADSTSAMMTTISGFETSQDRIALGRGIGAVTVSESGGNTVMANSSGFSLTIEGNGLNLTLDNHYWHIGGTPSSSSAVRGHGGREIIAFAIGDGHAPAEDAAPGEAASTIADFAVDGDDAEIVSGFPADAGVPESFDSALSAGLDVNGDAAAPSTGCDDYVCSLGLI